MNWDTYLFFKTSAVLVFVFAGGFFAHKKTGCSLIQGLFITVCAAMLGFALSRVWYIIQYTFGSKPYHPRTFARAWNEAGSVLYGWIFGGTIAIFFLTKLFRIHTIKFMDTVAPWMLVSQTLNRFGCFAGQCCWGKQTGFFISVWNRHIKAYLHPVQLYEAAFDAALLCFILKRAKPARGGSAAHFGGRTGEATWLYFSGYALGRFFLEFIRGDNGPALLFLTVPQVASVLTLLAVWRFKKNILQPGTASGG